MRVDPVAEDLSKRFQVGANDLRTMHEEWVVVSDGEDDDDEAATAAAVEGTMQVDVALDSQDQKPDVKQEPDVVSTIKAEPEIDV